MTYLIDAWLERPEPRLRILHCGTGRVCAELDSQASRELVDQGDLDVHELEQTPPHAQKETVRQLFLLCYARALGQNHWL